MSDLLRRHEVLSFLCLIVVVNALFVAACAEGVLPDGLYNYGRFALLGGVMVLVVYVSRGFFAVLDLFRPLAHWRVSPKWYLLALLWAFSLGAVVLAGKVLFTNTKITDIALQLGVVSNPRIMATLIIGALIGEIVWISYSIKHLSHRHTVFVASLIVGLFWTAWWMPMAYYNYGIIPGLKLAPLLINQTGVALMCGLFYYHTRSALCVLVLQIGVNGSILMLPVLPTTGGENTYWAFSITYFIAAVLLYLYLGPKPLLAREPDSKAAAPNAPRLVNGLDSQVMRKQGHLGVLRSSYVSPTGAVSK